MTFNISILNIKESDQKYYRENNWCLYAFKFCEGRGGNGHVPTWFALNPKDWSETIEIIYTPSYSVFYSKFKQVDNDTVIRTSTKTSALPLGSKVRLNENNRLEVLEEGKGIGPINVENNSSAGQVLLGLAGESDAHVDKNTPFAVFDVAEGNILTMEPIEKVLIVLAALNIQQGCIRSSTFAPGVLIDFTKFSHGENPTVNLRLERSKNGVVAADPSSTGLISDVTSSTALSVLGPKK
ncbi:MAG: hypothetical protein RLP12_02800 [Ekhidna sp.]